MRVGTRAVLWLTALLGVLHAGCGEPKGLRESDQPLVALDVSVRGELADVVPAGVDPRAIELRAALVWLDVPSPDRFCLEQGLGAGGEASAAALAAAGCKDVFAVAPALVQASAPVVGGRASLRLMDLPTAEVLVGTPGARVAYGTVVLYADTNDNGALDLGSPWHSFVSSGKGQGTRVGMGAGGDASGVSANPSDGDHDGHASFGEHPPEGPSEADAAYGASFSSMLRPHTRVVFREGDFGKALSLFYPMMGCAAPPQGFSLARVSGPPTRAICTYGDPATTAIEVPLQATEVAAPVICRNDPFHYHDKTRRPDLSLPHHCIDGNELLVADPPGPCKGLTGILLRGCRDDPDCDPPDWDDTDAPPDWWPCVQTPGKKDSGKGRGKGPGAGGGKG